MSLPLARTIILTDAGTMAYSEELAAYDGTPNGSVTPTPVSIAGTPPPTGQVGQPYTFTPTITGGSGTRVVAIASGTLLAGLSLNTSTGAITGIPTVAGTMTGLSVRVTDDTGSAATTPTTVTIATASVALSISGLPPTTGQVGTAYTFTPAASGGSGTKVYALASGTLLAGLSLNTSTGAITGTPTAAGTMTSLSVRVTDNTGSASTTPTTVTIAAATNPPASSTLTYRGEALTFRGQPLTYGA